MILMTQLFTFLKNYLIDLIKNNLIILNKWRKEMYILIGIASTGFLGKYPLCIYGLLSSIIIYMALKRKFVYPTNKNFYIMLFFSLAYSMITYIKYNQFSSFLLLAPPISYYIGETICKFCKSDEKYISKCIIAIAIGFFIHAMLNFIINIGANNRNTIDFWTKTYASATLQGTMLTMILSILFFGVFYIKKMHIKIIYIMCVILSLMYITVIATRTQIIITAIVFIFMLVLDSILNRKIKKVSKILFVVFFICIAIYALYLNNTFNIKNYLGKSNIVQRLGKQETNQSDESRIKNQILGLKALIENPFGNTEKIGNLQYVHNMWLDVGKETGIIPFIILIIYTINTFISLWHIIENKKLSIKYKILISSVYLGVNINFAVEPILQGAPFFFSMFIIINGLIDSQNVCLKANEK